jgi:hypothetical protein
VDLRCELYEESLLDSWLDPDSSEPAPEPAPNEEAVWFGESRIGYDADISASIQGEPEWRWFG